MNELIAHIDKIEQDPELASISIREGCVLVRMSNPISGKKYVFGIDSDHLKSFSEFLKNIEWIKEN